MIEHLNIFNAMSSSILYVDINISNEYKSTNLLYYLQYLWDSFFVSIGTAPTNLTFDDTVSSLISSGIRQKNMEIHNIDSLSTIGLFKNRK